MTRLIRCIAWFDKKTEYMVSREELKDLSVEEIRELLQLPYDPEDPELYYGYNVTEEAANKLKLHMEHKFNFKKYDYQFSCYQGP